MFGLNEYTYMKYTNDNGKVFQVITAGGVHQAASHIAGEVEAESLRQSEESGEFETQEEAEAFAEELRADFVTAFDNGFDDSVEYATLTLDMPEVD